MEGIPNFGDAFFLWHELTLHPAAMASMLKGELMVSYQAVKGYSLPEAMVVMLVFSLCMTQAVPAMSRVVDNVRIKTGVLALMDSLHLTRSEAIRRNARVVLCKSASGSACTPTGAWERGWIVFQDANGNGVVDPGEEVLRREASLPSNLRIVGNSTVDDYVAYTGLGKTTLNSGAFQAGTITVCQPSIQRVDGYQIVINSSGRARVAKAALKACL